MSILEAVPTPLDHEANLTSSGAELANLLEDYDERDSERLEEALGNLEAAMHELTKDLPEQKIPGEDEALALYRQACLKLNRPQIFHLDPDTQRIEPGAPPGEEE